MAVWPLAAGHPLWAGEVALSWAQAGTAPCAAPLTQRGGQEAMHQDVSEAADGRGEVRVERHIEGIVAELRLVLQHPRAEVQGHLGRWGGPQSLARLGAGWVCSASLGDSEPHEGQSWGRGPTCQAAGS